METTNTAAAKLLEISDRLWDRGIRSNTARSVLLSLGAKMGTGVDGLVRDAAGARGTVMGVSVAVDADGIRVDGGAPTRSTAEAWARLGRAYRGDAAFVTGYVRAMHG